MFKKKQSRVKQVMNSFVAIGTIINGDIHSQGDLVINGGVNGNIKTDGDIIIGDSASISGNATAGSITIGGNVTGNISASGILRILSTAILKGDINVGGFIADEGGTFVGRCSMTKPPQKLIESMFVEKRDNAIFLKSRVVNE